MKEIAVMLPGVRSAHNVGSIFRTADAAGISRVYLCGVTPAPIDRFGRVQKEIQKTALGAERYVPWERHASTLRLIRALKREKWRIVGVEQDERARDYRSLRLTQKTVFIFGNEVRGLPRSIRDACDVLIEIPMRGTKESLNVAVATGVVLFSTTQRRPYAPRRRGGG